MQVRTAKDLGAALRQARIERALTQVQLAKMLRVNQARISEIERGSNGTAVGTILRMLGALHASIDISLDGEKASKRHTGVHDVDLDAIADTGLAAWPQGRPCHRARAAR